MNLKHLSDFEVTSRLERLVRSERKITHLVLLHILEIEERRIYADLGYDGMYSYLTLKLGYSDGSAYRRLQSARLLKKVPALSEKIESGALNLSQLTQVQRCLKESQKNGEVVSTEATLDILNKIQNKNTFETEKVLAKEMNLPIEWQEKIKPQKDDSVRLEITLSQRQYEDLLQSKSLLSHLCPDGNLSDVIGLLAATYNQKKLVGRVHKGFDKEVSMSASLDQNRKAKKPESKSSSEKIKAMNTLGVTRHVVAAGFVSKESDKPSLAEKNRRSYIPLSTKRALLERARYTCEYKDPKTHKACSSKYQLQIDHRKPVALGGDSKPENLRVLCRQHNLLMAHKWGLEQ